MNGVLEKNTLENVWMYYQKGMVPKHFLLIKSRLLTLDKFKKEYLEEDFCYFLSLLQLMFIIYILLYNSKLIKTLKIYFFEIFKIT